MGGSARHLGYSGVTFDGSARLNGAGGTEGKQCCVIGPRRGESVKITMGAKTPSGPPNGHKLRPLPFPTIPQSQCCLSRDPLSPSGSCRYFSGGPMATQTYLHYSLCIVKIYLSFP